MKLLLKLSGGHNLGYNKPGLGPNAWGWIRILVPYQSLFYKASKAHDALYTMGGMKEDKNKADWILYKEMLEKCKTDLQSWFALLYYELVSKFGFLFFNYHEEWTIHLHTH